VKYSRALLVRENQSGLVEAKRFSKPRNVNCCYYLTQVDEDNPIFNGKKKRETLKIVWYFYHQGMAERRASFPLVHRVVMNAVQAIASL